MTKIGVLGGGTMGSGIVQVAAQNGHNVVLVDLNEQILHRSKEQLAKILDRLVEKEKITSEESAAIQSRIVYSQDVHDFRDCGMVIEAIIEDVKIKKDVFKRIELIVKRDCVLASNTSSLSIASIAGALEYPHRMLGIHFFNPAPLMPLVEIIPAVQTSEEVLNWSTSLIDSCRHPVSLSATSRPFYGEALRIYEEGVADFATIDWAMTELGGFRMGPFTLMDYIGNDINYTVTETVFEAFYYDPRYKPSFTQKRHAEAGYFGRKSGRGYYNYAEGAAQPEPNKDVALGNAIFERILVMLINEAVDALFLNIGTKEAIDLAMTKGVNYPKGLLAWADELGLEFVLGKLQDLYEEYGEDRYRPSPLLRRMVKANQRFFA